MAYRWQNARGVFPRFSLSIALGLTLSACSHGSTPASEIPDASAPAVLDGRIEGEVDAPVDAAAEPYLCRTAMDGNKDILGCLGIGMDFSVASNALEDGLAADGHFFLECRHNCGHVEPPLDPPPGGSKYAGIWQFALDHPFWLAAGQSPYLMKGLPAALPSWCAIGAGSSTPRSGGGCPAAENPCAY